MLASIAGFAAKQHVKIVPSGKSIWSSVPSPVSLKMRRASILFAYNLRTLDKIMVHRLDTSRLCELTGLTIRESKGTAAFLRAARLDVNTLVIVLTDAPVALCGKNNSGNLGTNLLGNPNVAGSRLTVLP